MQLQLDPRWTEKLARMPESGMGYQRVRVRLRAGRTIDQALVYNASVLEVPDGVAPFGPQDIDDIEMVAGKGR
jgi:hypothetical protein